MQKHTAPTMKDVAKEASVSLGTVSKVINHIPVGDNYKRKVEEAIAKLNYEVNTYARGLKVHKTNTVTLIVPDALNPFFASFIHYIESALYKEKHFLTLCCANNIPEKEIEYLNMAVQNQSDGVIALTYSDIGKYVPSSLPVVSFDRLFDNNHTPRVASDNLSGGIMATEKLISLGCKQPLFIRFSSRFPGETDKRLDGYLQACTKHKITPMVLDKRDTDNSEKDILDFIKSCRSTGATLSFDGIFANTDAHAYQAACILKKLGYNVPKDIQIIGFDGIHKFGSEQEDLFVSSICQPVPLLAQTCVDLILAKNRSVLPSLTLLPVYYQSSGTTRD